MSIKTVLKSDLHNFISWGKKILAVGRNYKDHCIEMGSDLPKKPLLFMKPSSSYLTQNSGPIMIPDGCSELHHEVELGVIIKDKCTKVNEDQAFGAIGGYVLALDMTARDIQNEAKAKGEPWTMAKGFDTSLPVSRLLDLGEVQNPSNLELWCKVNDVERQRGSTADMIFNIPYLISYISRNITLEPGDMVLTGTPSGVGPVKDGDHITCGISDLVQMTFNVQGGKP